MASRLNPYLNFAGNAREAMERYQQILGGELRVMTFGDMGETDPALTTKVMHAQLETDHGFTLMASDGPPGLDLVSGNNFAVSLSGDDADDLRGYWAALSDGGTVTVPLDKQAWGDEFGQCVDRFGVAWMVNITQPA